MPNQDKISWQAPEYKHYEKTIGWYVSLISIGILLIGFFVIQSDYFAAVVMALLTLVVIFFAKQTPNIIDISLSPKGIHFGDIIYPYKQIKHFWIVNHPNHKTAVLETTAYLNRKLIIELMEQDPDEIRQFLLGYIQEHPENDHPTFSQKVSHTLKF